MRDNVTAFCGDCVVVMRQEIPDASIEMVCTTAQQAIKVGRKAIAIDTNAEYLKLFR